MNATQLLHLLAAAGRPRALVLGDLLLDRYTWGDAERISQEAPVIVLRADRRESRLGGAANVCHMLRGLEAKVTCAGVVGQDEAGLAIHHLLVRAGIQAELVLGDERRPTTVKERFIGRAGSRHPNQILRVDHEVREAIGEDVEARLLAGLEDAVGRHDVLIISDYAKGVCTPRLLQGAIAAARRAGIPVLVDPARDVDYERYRGATLLKPNRAETQSAVGRTIRSSDEALEAGRQLCRQLDLEMAVITLDSDGMILARPDGSGVSVPTRARAVYDITGAGDMVMAVLGLGLGDGLAAEAAVELGTVAGGLEVEKTGVALVTREEIRAELEARRRPDAGKHLTLEAAAQATREHRAAGRRVVFTNGCFDLLHVGHATYLAEAAALGDVLVVAVNSDASVRRLKGDGRPVIGENDRAAMLAALACVDHVVVFDDATPHRLLEALRPDVLVKGGTYTTDEVVGREIVESYGGRVCVTGVVDGISTTRIVRSLQRPRDEVESTPNEIESTPNEVPSTRDEVQPTCDEVQPARDGGEPSWRAAG